MSEICGKCGMEESHGNHSKTVMDLVHPFQEDLKSGRFDAPSVSPSTPMSGLVQMPVAEKEKCDHDFPWREETCMGCGEKQEAKGKKK